MKQTSNKRKPTQELDSVVESEQSASRTTALSGKFILKFKIALGNSLVDFETAGLRLMINCIISFSADYFKM